MDAYHTGDFILICCRESSKIALLKSQQSEDFYDVEWFIFAHEIKSNMCMEENISFDKCEILHVVDDNLPKYIERKNIWKKCTVILLEDPDVTCAGFASLDNNVFFSRFSLNGSSLSSLPRNLMKFSSTSSVSNELKKSKKSVRVSFVGVGGLTEDNEMDVDEDMKKPQAQSYKIKPSPDDEESVEASESNVMIDLSNVRFPAVSLKRLDLTSSHDDDFKSSPAKKRDLLESPKPPNSPARNRNAADSPRPLKSEESPAVRKSNRKPVKDLPTSEAPEPRRSRSSKSNAIAAISAYRHISISPSPKSSSEDEAKNSPKQQRLAKAGDSENRSSNSKIRTEENHSPVEASESIEQVEATESPKQQRIAKAGDSEKSPLSVIRKARRSGLRESPLARVLISVDYIGTRKSPLTRSSPRTTDSPKSVKTPGSAQPSSKTPKSASEVRLTPKAQGTPTGNRPSPRTPKTPSTLALKTRTSRTPRTPTAQLAAAETAVQQSPRTPRTRQTPNTTPAALQTQSSSRTQTPKTPRTPKSAQLAADTDVRQSPRTPRTRQTPKTTPAALQTKSSSKTQTPKTPRTAKTPVINLVTDDEKPVEALETAERTMRDKKVKLAETPQRDASPIPGNGDFSPSSSRRNARFSREFKTPTFLSPRGDAEEESSQTADDKDDGAIFVRSRRSCKTAALKALQLSSQSAVLVTHTFPEWRPSNSSRKKLVGHRRNTIASGVDSPLAQVRRLQLTEGFSRGKRDANRRLDRFRRSHRRTADDSSSSDDDDEDFLPSSSDSDSDLEDLARRKRRRVGPHTPSSAASKRRRGTLLDVDDQPLLLPARAVEVGTPEKDSDAARRKNKGRGCKVQLVERSPERMLEEAKLRLHVSSLSSMEPSAGGKALTCREEEFEDIYRFVSQRLRGIDAGEGGCMYISGLPGTGKTATVSAVVNALRSAKPAFAAFDLVEVNGMRLTDPQQVYAHVLRQLTGNKCTAKHSANLLDKEFKKKGRKPCLLIVDELDLLCTRRQQVLYNLFDWPQRASSRLTVLAIANTMDLPERLLHQKVASRLGLTRLVFQPYNHHQLHSIVSERLAGLNCFQKEALELTARKVAAISGDARRALDICRRAAELAEGSQDKQVGLRQVDAAIKEMFASSKVRAITECSVYEQMCLRAVLAELSRTGLEEAQLDRCVRQMDTLCRCEGLPLLTGGEVFTVVVRLSSHKLLLCEHFRQDGKMKLRLNCAQHDVTFALKDVKYDGVLIQN